VLRDLPPKVSAGLRRTQGEKEAQIERMYSMTNSNSECLSAVYSGGEESDGGDKGGEASRQKNDKNAGRDKRSVKFDEADGGGIEQEAEYAAS